jgi:osmotically inducible lipoprotein OsmB
MTVDGMDRQRTSVCRGCHTPVALANVALANRTDGNRPAVGTFLQDRQIFQEAFMSRIPTLVVLTAVALSAAACGDRPVDRALTGGAIGAGTGAVVGSTVGNPVAGAVVGGLGGAAIGAATAPRSQYD